VAHDDQRGVEAVVNGRQRLQHRIGRRGVELPRRFADDLSFSNVCIALGAVAVVGGVLVW
jgi:hypothetical protein